MSQRRETQMSAWARELRVQLLSSTSIVQGQRQGGTGLSYWTLTAARLTVSLASKHHGAAYPTPCHSSPVHPTHSPTHSSTHLSTHPALLSFICAFIHSPSVFLALRHLPHPSTHSCNDSRERCVDTWLGGWGGCSFHTSDLISLRYWCN